MRPSSWRSATTRLVFAASILILDGSLSHACSGPGASRSIMWSEIIGTVLAGLSIAIVVVGCRLVRRRIPRRRIRWIVAPLALHPRLWMDAAHGDCGFMLVSYSLVATIGVAIVVGLAIFWPSSEEVNPKTWRWALSGALVGSLFGLLVVGEMLMQLGPASTAIGLLALSVLCGAVFAGSLIGRGLFLLRAHDERGLRHGLWTLPLLAIALAPLFVVMLPVLPYESSVSTSSPFRFEVVDATTNQLIPNAAVRLIDPTFALDDASNQGERVVTGANGRASYYLFANAHGREGLLGRTETISYNPLLIQVEAHNYLPFFTSLSNPAPIPIDRLTAAPLGLTFPPPSSVTIRLSPDHGPAVAAGELHDVPPAPDDQPTRP